MEVGKMKSALTNSHPRITILGRGQFWKINNLLTKIFVRPYPDRREKCGQTEI